MYESLNDTHLYIYLFLLVIKNILTCSRRMNTYDTVAI